MDTIAMEAGKISMKLHIFHLYVCVDLFTLFKSNHTRLILCS